MADVARVGPAFSGVVTAQILEIEKHPNADRLSLCRVTDGAETYSVVCGAKNIAVGQRVPLARVGARLPGGQIERSKIRGVESHGMICSTVELGLGADAAGIMVMDSAVKLGQDVADLLGGADEVLDVEITPNRPDCLSHLGLARELAAYFRIPLRSRAAAAPAPAGALVAEIPVRIEAPLACPRYAGRTFEGLSLGPSPEWLKRRLEAVGLRPINSLVDITNFILMDLGQPLHVFDADKLEGGKILVRFAAAGETIKALDARDYALTPECLVIADARRPVAVAGVMGGAETGVTAATTRAFLESAHFDPATIRKTSQSLRLRSDSSYRFERGTDVDAVTTASDAAAALIRAHCAAPGPFKESKPQDLYPTISPVMPIRVTGERINKILGSTFEDREIKDALAAIAARQSVSPEGEISFSPPSYRPHLSTPWDLAEETARLLGYQNIPAHTGSAPIRALRDLRSHGIAARARARLAAAGLCEAYNYDFISEKLLAQGRLSADSAARLANPLSEDWAILRPTLLPGLLQNAQLNLNRGAPSVRLFELGKVYRREGAEVVEGARLGGLILGTDGPVHWRRKAAPADFFDAKGIVADLARGLLDLKWEPAAGKSDPALPLFHPQACLQVSIPEGPLGIVGLIAPQIARAWDLPAGGAAAFELDLDLLAGLDASELTFRPFSVLPSSWRDLSFTVPKELGFEKVALATASCAIAELAALDLVDVFTGPGVPEGRKSLTVRLTFADMDRTLKDSEVTAAVDKILGALRSQASAILRG